MNRSGTVKTPNRKFTTFPGNMPQGAETDARGSKLSRLIDWLGSARRINTDINDEMETLKFEVQVLRYANKHLRGELAEAKPLIAYALKRKASLAKYDKKRGRG